MTEGYRTASAAPSARVRLRSHEGFASAAVFVVTSCFVMTLAMMTDRTLVNCSTGSCEFHRLGNFGSKTERVAIRDIRGTRVVEGDRSQLLVLTRRYQEIEIARAMPVDTLRAAATDLDRFVTSGKPTYRALIEPPSNKAVYAVILLAIALGLRLLLETSVWLSFEIEEGQLRVHQRTWRGTRVRTASVRVDQIAEVFMKTIEGEDNSISMLSLRMQDGAELALEDGAGTHDRERARKALQDLLTSTA